MQTIVDKMQDGIQEISDNQKKVKSSCGVRWGNGATQEWGIAKNIYIKVPQVMLQFKLK